MLKKILKGIQEIEQGNSIPHDQVMANAMKRLDLIFFHLQNTIQLELYLKTTKKFIIHHSIQFLRKLNFQNPLKKALQ